MGVDNLLTALPRQLAAERFDSLLEREGVRLERIVSTGHSTPEGEWYDQGWEEWVMVLQGEALLRFDDGEEQRLTPGDQMLIPAHRRHRVAWTTPDEPTVWLALHIGEER